MKTLRTDKQKLIMIFILSLFLLVICFFISLIFGTEKISIIQAFTQKDSPNFHRIIFFDIRLPRVILAALSGALLAGSGAIFQLFFRNELAEPGIIGISSGATLGAVIASSVGIPAASATSFFLFKIISPINIFAFAGALGAGFLISFLAFYQNKKGKSETSVMLLLCGTALGTLYSSISSVILLSSNKEMRSIYSWILGSFNGHGWNELLFILIPSAISITIMILIQPQLDLLGCGEYSAQSLGISVNRLRILVLISAGFAVSAAVCAGGTISFVGLIAPHIVRKLTTSKSKILIPFSMIFGAILLLLSDLIARTIIAPAELPAGIITSILGVPFFLSLFLQKK